MRNRLYFVLILIWVLTACQTVAIAPTHPPSAQTSAQPVSTSAEVKALLPSMIPESTPTGSISPSATDSLVPLPTNILNTTIAVNLSNFDWDVRPPIDVSHEPPLIAKSNETVMLKFSLACAYDRPPCNPTANLFFSYGERDKFNSQPLQQKTEGWVTNLPASDEKGQSLRYYLQVNDPAAGLDVRYPLEGTLDLFTTPDFIRIDLSDQQPAEVRDLALKLPWGDGLEAVGLQKYDGYPPLVGPLAMDAADDGRIALLDYVNERILIFDPNEKMYLANPLPFKLQGRGDIQFDRNGQVAVFDPVGEPMDQSTVNIPQIYRLLSDGRVGVQAPVFVWIPGRLTQDLEVFDLRDRRFVAPFLSSGEINSREGQRHRRNPNLLYRYVKGLEPYVARFADVEAGLAFELHSVSPLGAIISLDKTLQGYMVVIEVQPQYRAIWFDRSGVVLKDVVLPDEYYTDMSFSSRTSVNSHGDLYVLNSTKTGVQILYVAAP